MASEQASEAPAAGSLADRISKPDEAQPETKPEAQSEAQPAGTNVRS